MLQKGNAEMSIRREPNEAQKKRMREAIAQESKPEVMAALLVQQAAAMRAAKAQTLAQQTLALLLAEKERQSVSLATQERCGITRGNISKLLNDPEPNATLATIERIAAAMGVKVCVTLSK